MKPTRRELLRERIRHHESQLDSACFQREEPTKKLKTCSVRERGAIERELSAIQTRIDYHFRQASDSGAEELELECQRARRR